MCCPGLAGTKTSAGSRPASPFPTVVGKSGVDRQTGRHGDLLVPAEVGDVEALHAVANTDGPSVKAARRFARKGVGTPTRWLSTETRMLGSNVSRPIR